MLASVAGNFLQKNESSDPKNVVFVEDPCSFCGTNIKDKYEDERRSFMRDSFDHGACSEIASAFVPSMQGKHGNHRYIHLNGYLVDNKNVLIL